MNNQPLPKPSQSQKNNNPNKSGGVSTPPPSALNNSSDNSLPKGNKNSSNNNQKVIENNKKPAKGSQEFAKKSKQGVVFDGDTAKTRIPLTQKSSKNPKTNDGGIKLPPTSLSALSSMSSNTIPEETLIPNPGQNKTDQSVKKTTMPEKTVLGKPIPQAIRGEKLPLGLNSKAPDPSIISPVPSPKIVQEKSSPVPQMSSSSNTNINKEAKPKFAVEKKSVLKFLPFILGGLVILIIAGIVISKLFGGKSTSLPDQGSDAETNTAGTAGGSDKETEKRTEVPAEQTEIVYWGLWEPNEVVEEIISDFEADNPGVKITYVKQSHKNYRERLQTALETKEGPDIFRFHASWAPMIKSGLSPIPTSVISAKEFKDNYYPIVTDQLVVSGQYVGIPLMYDGLALYYNEDILESANETPPSTWAELRLLAAKLTVESANGIERAGLAIGNATNVDHFSDILAVLMLQNGANFSDPNSQETRDALLFYTNFVLKDGVWNEKLPSSTVAFARGDVAMMFAPSWRAHEISAQNPELRFKTMTLPQLSEERISWGSYWAEGISTNSENKEVAAEFLGFLSSDESLMKLFSKASEVRAFGEIYPKVSMAEKLVDNDIVAPYLDDAAYAQSWYLNSFTHDNGINDQVIEYYRDGVNAIIEGEDVEEVLLFIESGTKEVLKQYGISSK